MIILQQNVLNLIILENDWNGSQELKDFRKDNQLLIFRVNALSAFTLTSILLFKSDTENITPSPLKKSQKNLQSSSAVIQSWLRKRKQTIYLFWTYQAFYTDDVHQGFRIFTLGAQNPICFHNRDLMLLHLQVKEQLNQFLGIIISPLQIDFISHIFRLQFYQIRQFV